MKILQRDFDKLHCGRLTDWLMCAVTFVVYLVTLPIDLLLGIPFRCFPRLVKKVPPEIDWGIVMGCGYDISTNALHARLDTALQLYKQRPNIRLMLSGTESDDYSEPRYMENYLRERDFPAEKIFRDGKGFNTAATFKNARRFGIDRAVIVTNDFHLLRCVDTARLYGLQAYGYVVPPVEKRTLRPYRWRYWLREKLAHYWGYGRFLLERWKNATES